MEKTVEVSFYEEKTDQSEISGVENQSENVNTNEIEAGQFNSSVQISE